MPGGMEDIYKMIEAAPSPRHRALVALVGLCGMRVSEARSVKPSSIDLSKNLIEVRGKGDRQRFIPVSHRAWDAISEAFVESIEYDSTLCRMADSTARDAFKMIAKRAGIVGEVHTHQGRASVATEMLNRSGNIRLVQEFLGHSSSTTTEVYTNVTMEQMEEAVNF